jgi:hypothetical protein
VGRGARTCALRRFSLGFAALLLDLVAAPGLAGVVTLSLSGSVTASSLPGVLGAPWSLEIVYASDSAPIAETPLVAIYDAFYIASFSIDSANVPPHLLSLSPELIVIENGNAGRDQLLSEAELVDAQGAFSLYLVDEDGEVFGSTALPTSLEELTAFEHKYFELLDLDENEITGQVSGLTLSVSVPEPTAAPLLGLGLLALAAHPPRRMGRRSRSARGDPAASGHARTPRGLGAIRRRRGRAGAAAPRRPR